MLPLTHPIINPEEGLLPSQGKCPLKGSDPTEVPEVMVVQCTQENEVGQFPPSTANNVNVILVDKDSTADDTGKLNPFDGSLEEADSKIILLNETPMDEGEEVIILASDFANRPLSPQSKQGSVVEQEILEPQNKEESRVDSVLLISPSEDEVDVQSDNSIILIDNPLFDSPPTGRRRRRNRLRRRAR